MNYKLSKRLFPGDTIAIVSPSWGGPSVFPHVYENGLKVLRKWGLKIKEYPTARADAKLLHKNPKMRADDINAAFADKEVKAIFATIGGDDSVRILPFIDPKVITGNPKILMGYSDTTTLNTLGNLLGLVTFNGPSIMAGFSQMENLPSAYEEHTMQMLFQPSQTYEYSSYGQYCDKYLDWEKPENVGKVEPLKAADGWRFIQGAGTVDGGLWGGCIEVLEFMKGTAFWPDKNFWKGRILFFETSEEKPPVGNVKYMLRNYGMQGVFDKASAILFGRARDYSPEEKRQLEEMLRDVVGGEFGRPDLPIVTNMDFGHTDPQHILPLGVKAQIDCNDKSFKLIEPWLE